MPESFSNGVRKVMVLANQEAHRLKHEYIGTEHILLGLVREGSGVGTNILKNLGIDFHKVRLEVEKLVRSGSGTSMGKLPQTPRAKAVIEFAIEEARILKQNTVGTEHLWIGLLREHDGVGGTVLKSLGLKIEDVREEIHNLLGLNTEAESPEEAKTENETGHRLALGEISGDLLIIATELKRLGRAVESDVVICIAKHLIQSQS